MAQRLRHPDRIHRDRSRRRAHAACAEPAWPGPDEAPGAGLQRRRRVRQLLPPQVDDASSATTAATGPTTSCSTARPTGRAWARSATRTSASTAARDSAQRYQKHLDYWYKNFPGSARSPADRRCGPAGPRWTDQLIFGSGDNAVYEDGTSGGLRPVRQHRPRTDGWPDLGPRPQARRPGHRAAAPWRTVPLDVCVDGRRVWTFWTCATPAGRGPCGPAPAAWPGRSRWPAPRRPRPDHACATPRRPVSTSTARCRSAPARAGSRSATRRGSSSGSTSRASWCRPSPAAPTATSRRSSTPPRRWSGRCSPPGIEPFLAYGTLLGAVREGAVLGHDSDADLGYVSRHSTPSTSPASRSGCSATLAEHGWTTSRYSGAAFKVLVSTEADGVDPRARRLRRLPRRRPALPDGRDRHRLRAGVDLPAGQLRARRPADAGAGPAGEAARGDVRPGLAGARPGLQVHAPPERTIRALRRLVPRHPARHPATGSALRRRTRAARRSAAPSGLARKAAARRAGSAQRCSTSAPARGADSLWLAAQGPGDRLRLRAARAARAAAGRAGRGLDARRAPPQPDRVALGARRGRPAGPRAAAPGGPGAARRRRDRSGSAGSPARLCSMALRGGRPPARRVPRRADGDPDARVGASARSTRARWSRAAARRRSGASRSPDGEAARRGRR